MGRPLIDLSGRRFGRLLVLRRNVRPWHKGTSWHCRCDCGTPRIVKAGNLANGTTKSCGCLIREEMAKRRARGVKHLPEYHAWVQARARCRDKNHSAYKWYGGRGIAVCDRWDKSFVTFYKDMGPRPTPKHTLDRVDSDGPYSPDNCRWATQLQQQNNRRDNRHLTVGGKTHTMSEWERINGLVPGRICGRIQHGWTVERAVMTPARKRRKPIAELVEDVRE